MNVPSVKRAPRRGSASERLGAAGQDAGGESAQGRARWTPSARGSSDQIARPEPMRGRRARDGRGDPRPRPRPAQGLERRE